MTATKTVYYVRDDGGIYEHGPFSDRRRAEEFAIALANGGRIRGAIDIRARTVDVDDDDDDDKNED